MIHIIPNQMFGLGDIVFTQTLVHKIANGNPIIWGVYPQFVEGLRRAYPHIYWRDYRDMPIDWNRQEQFECDVKGIGKCVVLPIRFSGDILKLPYNQCMRAKYDLYGLDWESWRDKAMWERDALRETELMLEYDYSSDLKTMYPFIFKNETFGSDCKLKINIKDKLLTGIPTIEMFPIQRFSLFDWASIFDKAEQIHTVSTSIIYLLEMLDLRAPEIHLYNRPIAGQGFDNVNYILQKHKYIYHG